MGWALLGPFDTSLLPVTYAVLWCLLPAYVLLLLLRTPCQQQAISLGSSQAAYSPTASFCQLPDCCSSSHVGFSLSNMAYSTPETPVCTRNLNTVLQRHTIYWTVRGCLGFDRYGCEDWLFLIFSSGKYFFGMMLTFTIVHHKKLQISMKRKL